MGRTFTRAWRGVAFAAVTLTAVTALAEQGALPAAQLAVPAAQLAVPAEQTAEPTEPQKPKPPGKSKLDAGGQVRLPSGPDENGQFATFNWIALDLKGRYSLLDAISINASIPLAVKKPDVLMTGEDPKMIGGMSVTFEARIPQPSQQANVYGGDFGLVLTGAYMREGAMLLSKNDFPLFDGPFKPGLAAGLIARFNLSSLLDFSTTPVLVYQAGTDERVTAIQLPTSTIIKLGSLLELSADLDIFTGDDFSFRPSNGGRIAAGGSITVKIGPILAHAGAGFASLFPGGAYPTLRDSMYIDLNVKYAK